MVLTLIFFFHRQWFGWSPAEHHRIRSINRVKSELRTLPHNRWEYLMGPVQSWQLPRAVRCQLGVRLPLWEARDAQESIWGRATVLWKSAVFRDPKIDRYRGFPTGQQVKSHSGDVDAGQTVAWWLSKFICSERRYPVAWELLYRAIA